MTDLEKYMGLSYTALLRQDEEGDWIASIPELEGCVADGKSVEEAMAELEGVKRLWLETRLEAGLPIPAPSREETLPSGKWLQRVPRRLHAQLSKLANEEGVSLNQLVTSILSEAIGRRQRLEEPTPAAVFGSLEQNWTDLHPDPSHWLPALNWEITGININKNLLAHDCVNRIFHMFAPTNETLKTSPEPYDQKEEKWFATYK